ncbi:septum site-determining protein MinC [Thermohalobacter berrensis]|uniref:Probable septum site-determining protein MinC n=1 Tax=Thermohalobacter berrensis TaxID=99594 RepID=A0A419T726_9FIRM|nr:septum site-determining protein MinC [Thermohalobacter berrensis]RKD33219.1 septum site-determining protein MinC [Thermohalobacter berrensis]
MNDSLIEFKGNKEGLLVHIREGSFESIKISLNKKLKSAQNFFKGGKVIGFKGRTLTDEEKKELKSIIEDQYGLLVNETEDIKDKETNTYEDNYFKGIEEGRTKFLKTTLRSGQRIEYDGNVVVLGDVNPGSVIVATGNIIVLGSLRGTAHAGSNGNTEAIVAAFNLQPTQLRIANIIARSPDNEISKPLGPEIAKINNNNVLIEPYLPKK